MIGGECKFNFLELRQSVATGPYRKVPIISTNNQKRVRTLRRNGIATLYNSSNALEDFKYVHFDETVLQPFTNPPMRWRIFSTYTLTKRYCNPLQILQRIGGFLVRTL